MTHYKIMCLMAAGAPLTEKTTEVLLVNAVDMWDEKRQFQAIKSHSYDGVIESNLDVFEHFDVPVVMFKSLVAEAGQMQATEIRFLIRVDDLENMDPSTWVRITEETAEEPPYLPPSPDWN